MLNKILSLAVLLRYGKLPWEHRYFYRDTLRCQVQQWKYIWKGAPYRAGVAVR